MSKFKCLTTPISIAPAADVQVLLCGTHACVLSGSLRRRNCGGGREAGAFSHGPGGAGEVPEPTPRAQQLWRDAKGGPTNLAALARSAPAPQRTAAAPRRGARAGGAEPPPPAPPATGSRVLSLNRRSSPLGSGCSLPLGSGGALQGPPIRQEAPVQLIEVVREGSRWQYRVSQDGARVLESHGGRRIAVASVCGLYRTGKSYLLNLLLGRVQQGLPLFQVGSTTNACTEGLWLWGAADEDDLEAPLLAFVDCEGFGSTDSDRSRDAQLMTLCALISSVLVLNTKGALNEGVFNSLALTCRFAEHIFEETTSVSRPALMWVLRDFMLDLTSPDGRSISPDAYLEQALTSCSAAEVDDDRAQGAKEVKDSLLRFFDSRTCSVLVRPAHEESQLQQLERVPYRGLREEFRSGVEALRARIEAACAAGPKSVGGQALGCGAFVALLGKLVASIRASDIVAPRHLGLLGERPARGLRRPRGRAGGRRRPEAARHDRRGPRARRQAASAA
ncbi:unnamed protein product [Prorocentrum cordatum]|uniref:GB1/RHD3-type G domain-containing protein n=1 Tax=Prorocentrum cordatum TaxID=2364126 RepID=A0ABN9QMN9_9DINO|nr:unnamed protein product [Polarella glacialis]